MNRRDFLHAGTTGLTALFASLQLVSNAVQKTKIDSSAASQSDIIDRINNNIEPEAQETAALQSVLLRLICDGLSAQLNMPLEDVRGLLLIAQGRILDGADPFGKTFWDDTVDEFLREYGANASVEKFHARTIYI